MTYQEQVDNMTKDNNLSDYEMQLFLHKNGVVLYDEEIDNDTDIELLCHEAEKFGYTWLKDKEVWFKS